MLEKDMYKEMKKLFGNKGLLRRIESGVYVGFPDVIYTYCGTTGWIELKQTKQQKNGKIKIPYRPGQQGFLIENELHGGTGFVLLYLDNNFGSSHYFLINTSFNLKYFKNIECLCNSCCWVGDKLNNEFLSVL